MEDPSVIYPQMKPQYPGQEILKCPRCESTNTKFCYYNNYNLSQPRHFCKTCKRYWTKGGTLRNIPIGGASRKATKRSSNKCSSTTREKTEPLAVLPVPLLDHNSKIDVDVNGQFGNLLEAYTGKGSLNLGAVLGPDGAAQSGNNNTDEYWDSSSSTNDWPDLAIYNSGSSFQLLLKRRH